ncbi:MAG: glycosyltransferase [Caldilineaceae bacterium]|nr:glycosyltransferase [Caldilineaceae bacterium]
MPKHKLRFGLVTTYPPGNGSLNEYAYHFVQALRQKPEVAEVCLFVDDLPTGNQYADMTRGTTAPQAPLRFIPAWRFNDSGNVLRLLRAVRRAKVDVVLFNIQFASFGDHKIPAALGLLAPALLRASGIPAVVLLHNIMETVDLKSAGIADKPQLEQLIRFFGTLATRFILRANLVAVTIPKYVEILEARYGADNVLLAPHGAFEHVADVPTFDLPAGPLQIMTFGKFGTYKRVETLIEAFALLQARQSVPLELVIAGTGSPHTPNYLQEVADTYAHVPHIRFTGYVPEDAVATIFGEAAVVVFPYTSTTGSSGVLHQAGDYGKAVVLPQIGDLRELVAEEGYIGEFFEPDNPQALADAIARILDDPERRITMGRQNYLAARGLPLSDVIDWYLLHIDVLLQQMNRVEKQENMLMWAKR